MKKNEDTPAFEPENHITGESPKYQPANGRIPLFKDDNEMLHFYLHLSQLFCPNACRYSQGKSQLLLYKYKLRRLSRCLTVVLNFPWNEDFSVLQLGIGHALMDQSIPKKQRQQLIFRWSKATEYMKSMGEYSVMLQAMQLIFSEQKHDIQKLLQFLPSDPAEEALIEEMENEENMEES